jgi:hypothetical protein
MVKGLQKSHCEERANGGEIQVFDFAHLFSAAVRATEPSVPSRQFLPEAFTGG